MRPEPIKVPGRGMGYPIQVGLNNAGDCRKCGLPIYFYTNKRGARVPLDACNVLARQADETGGNDGVHREWLFLAVHALTCERKKE